MGMKKSFANMSSSKAAKRRIRSSIVKTSRWSCFEGYGFWGLIPRSLLRGAFIKHRLINSLAAYIDETGPCRVNDRAVLPPKISPVLPGSHHARRLTPVDYFRQRPVAPRSSPCPIAPPYFSNPLIKQGLFAMPQADTRNGMGLALKQDVSASTHGFSRGA